MEIQKVIELLQQKSNEAAYLASLPYYNNEYIPWRRNVEDILETAFGVDSTEYKRFHEEHVEIDSQKHAQEGYKTLIHRMQQEINSIIQKYEILGLKENSPIKKEDVKLESPIDLFDAMKFHPKVIEASRKLFHDGHYRDAIFRAFTEVNIYVKKKSKLEKTKLPEKQIMAKAFDEQNPIIKLNKLLTPTDKDEQEGFKFLFMGSTIGIRNPKAHLNIIQKNPYITLEYLALASLLLKRIYFWEVGTI